MDFLSEHIEQTGRERTLSGHQLTELITALDPDRKTGLKPVSRFTVAEKSSRVLRAALQCLRRREFTIPGGIDRTQRRVKAYFEKTYERDQSPLRLASLPVDKLKLRFDVEIGVSETGTVTMAATVDLPSWDREFERDLRTAAARPDLQTTHNVVLPPGRPLERAWSGSLLDYSGCATFDEIDDLARTPADETISPPIKALPLGFYAWSPRHPTPTDPDIAPRPPSLLFLSQFENGGLMAYNGTLVVAPQNSGKTELIVRWTIAANAAGYSVFVVDVKGEMHARLEKEGLRGDRMYFTTDPDPGVTSRRLNLLDGLDCITAEGRRRIAQLVEAMLPLSEAEDQDSREYWQVRTVWLSAMINLMLLRDLFAGRTTADMAELYRIASDESELLELIRIAKIGFDDLGSGAPTPPLRFWVTQLKEVIDPSYGGSRDPRYSYSLLMIGITTLLAPFSEAGILKERTSGRTDFRLEDINEQKPVTFILAAREQDGEDSRTILSMVIKRLEHIFYDRRKLRSPTPVLLLLDETRRIRGFQPAEYITFARDAKAGVVLVYQSLTQIRDPDRRAEILENVGTQIYLRSIAGETARQFIGMLPVRGRPTFSATETDADEGGSHTLQTGQEQIPYFSTAELYRLPAGTYPALVYIKDHRDGKPFLVDMDGERIKAAMPGPPSKSQMTKPQPSKSGNSAVIPARRY